MPEINKALQELKHILAYRIAYYAKINSMQKDNILALGLTSRRNLCIHPQISRETNGKIPTPIDKVRNRYCHSAVGASA